MEAWAEEQTSDFKVIALIGTNSLKEGEILAREVDRLGLWAAAILPPFYFKIDRVRQLADRSEERRVGKERRSGGAGAEETNGEMWRGEAAEHYRAGLRVE